MPLRAPKPRLRADSEAPVLSRTVVNRGGAVIGEQALWRCTRRPSRLLREGASRVLAQADAS